MTTPAVALVHRLLDERPATLGAAHLVCIDGPAGSGKTTLGRALAAATPQVRLVHMDDLYEGWTGLPRVAEQLAGLLGPLASGRPGRYRRWDWLADTWAEDVEVPPVPLLVLEGVGSWHPDHAALVSALVWVEVPRGIGLRRGLARDGEAARPHWLRWQDDEREHHARLRTRAHADVVVDGTGRTAPSLLA